jgi:hypothetical protein
MRWASRWMRSIRERENLLSARCGYLIGSHGWTVSDASRTGKKKGGPCGPPFCFKPRQCGVYAFTPGSPSFFLRSISHTKPKITSSTTGMMATALKDFSAA